MKIRVVCERCRNTGLQARLATYQSIARAERRVRDHASATGHKADLIPACESISPPSPDKET